MKNGKIEKRKLPMVLEPKLKGNITAVELFYIVQEKRSCIIGHATNKKDNEDNNAERESSESEEISNGDYDRAPVRRQHGR